MKNLIKNTIYVNTLVYYWFFYTFVNINKKQRWRKQLFLSKEEH